MAGSTESDDKAAVVPQQSLVEYLQAASWSITSPKIFDLLAPARKVLVAGCGGGYDILSGLPLYFALRRQGKSVYLAFHKVLQCEQHCYPDGFFALGRSCFLQQET